MKTFFTIILILGINFSAFTQDVTLLGSYASTIAVRVDINQPWVNSGISITQGDKVDIIAKGLATSNQSHSTWWCGPAGLHYSGEPNLPMPNQNVHSLIAKIGQNGTPFYIGNGNSFISNVTETLYFGYNDYLFSDNVGYYVAFVSGDPVTTDMSSNSQFSGNNHYEISQNYPNPFNPTTTIDYQITSPQNITIEIFDITGRLIKNLVNEYKTSGNYSVLWDGTDNAGTKVSSATYFYQLKTDNYSHTKKMILLK